MEKLGMAPNETMQLSELLTMKNLSLTKSVTMSPLVSDDELKCILKQDVVATQQHIRELKSLLEKSELAVPMDKCLH
jgi:similar to spore coat protein